MRLTPPGVQYVDDPIMVEAEDLFNAATKAAEILAADKNRPKDGKVLLRNGVRVNPAQLFKAGQILRNGPQPIANGISANMPGFVRANDQTGKSFVFCVGIIPQKIYRIDTRGRAREVS